MKFSRLFAFCSMSLSLLQCFAAPKTTREQLLRVWPGNAVMNIPFVAKAPGIDGFFTPGEWDKAAEFSGFSRLNGDYVTTGSGSVRLMRDKEYLYIAVRTTTPNNDPGGSLVANTTVRDGAVFRDDSLDFMLTPENEPVLYHWIINARDTVYDAKVELGATQRSDASWNFRNLRCASHVDKGFWDVELALPFSEIGNPANVLKFNVGRNWSKAGTSLLNPGSKYFDTKRMIKVWWKKHWGVLRQHDAGDVGRGEWKLSLSADNTTKKELCLAVMLRHNRYEKIKGKSVTHRIFDVVKEVRIPPQKSGSLDAAFSVSDNSRYHYTAVLFDPASGVIQGSRGFAGIRGSTERHPLSGSCEIKGVGIGEYRYYPGYDKAVMNFRPSAKNISNVAVVLSDDKKIAGVNDKNIFVLRFPVPAKVGKHEFALEINGKHHAAVLSLEKRNYPWC